MDADRWGRVHELLADALERTTEERAGWLAAACPDVELRREVESLLAQDSAVLDRLEPPPALGAEPAPGDVIGAYRIVEELDRGGMGVVYLAERADEEFERRVALKVLKRGLDTAEIVRRFRVERQILASLKHPYVAELYEGGTTADGRPYFVMEHVEGEHVDRWCDSRRLSVRSRLELFVKVCEAVQAAHRSLVVHRDLKPANILVTAAGEPKLLDFGIAKLLDPQTREPVLLTAATVRPMTPEYASPEQVKAEPVTTATDVYALGVLLYELLTGHRPYRLKPGPSPEDLRRAICEEEPERPSTMVTRPAERRGADGAGVVLAPEALSRARGEEPRRLQRRLRGDLDNVVLVALAKDPHRRYASVEQLAEDVRRHLAGLPVRARRPTFGYRAGKFLRRNARAVAAAALAFTSLAGVLVDRGLQQRETTRALARAERVTELLVELFRVSDPDEVRGNTITAREVLDRGAKRIREELREEPEVQAALMVAMGKVYVSLGLFDAAEPLLEDAVDLYRELPATRELEESLNEWGYLRYQQGDFQAAGSLYREALDLDRRSGRSPDALTARILNNLGLIHHARADYESAEALYRRALEIHRELEDDGRLEEPMILSNLGSVLRELGEHRESQAVHQEAVGLFRLLYGEKHPQVAMGLNNLAFLLVELGENEGAERRFREALEIHRHAYGDEHPDVALSLGNLCGLLHARRRYEDAEDLCRQALEINRRLLGEHPHVAANLTNLAKVLTGQGRPAEAEPLAREAARMYRAALPGGHWRVADAESVLGGCLHAVDRRAEAEALLLASYPILRDATGPGSRYTNDALRRLVDFYEAGNRPEQAAAYQALLGPARIDE